MKKKTESNARAPYFEHANNVTPDNSPIGYPDLAGTSSPNPLDYGKKEPPKRVIEYSKGRNVHSTNPERPQTYKMAPMSELKRMKLA